jgi:CHAD domain-containing protein
MPKKQPKKPINKGRPQPREDYPTLERIERSCLDALTELRKQRAHAIINTWAQLRDEDIWGTWDTLDALITNEVGHDQALAKAMVDTVMDIFHEHPMADDLLDAMEEVAIRIVGNLGLTFTPERSAA